MPAPPAEGLPPHARAAFEALRRRFADGLGARWAEIEHATGNAAQAAALHRLAGAAGGYGFDDVGAAARAAEQALAAGDEGGARAALGTLRDALAAAAVTVR